MMDKQKLEQAIKLFGAVVDGGTMQWKPDDGGWKDTELASTIHLCPSAYRVVRADGSIVYGDGREEPAPAKIERCEVVYEYCVLCYCNPHGQTLPLTTALEDPDFIAYEFEDDWRLMLPRIPTLDECLPAAVPVAVLFRKEGE